MLIGGYILTQRTRLEGSCRAQPMGSPFWVTIIKIPFIMTKLTRFKLSWRKAKIRPQVRCSRQQGRCRVFHRTKTRRFTKPTWSCPEVGWQGLNSRGSQPYWVIHEWHSRIIWIGRNRWGTWEGIIMEERMCLYVIEPTIIGITQAPI